MSKQKEVLIETKLNTAVYELSGKSRQDAERLWEQRVAQASGTEWYLEGVDIKKQWNAGRDAAEDVSKKQWNGAGDGKTELSLVRDIDQEAAHGSAGNHPQAPGRRRLRTLFQTMGAVAAVLVVVIFYRLNLRTDAVVFLDVNPGVSLSVNSREKVTRAEASNADGEKILQDMDLRRTDIDVAVNAFIGAMIRGGYLDEVQSTLLLSVDCADAQKKEDLRQRLSGEINEELLALLGKASVFDQEVEVDDDLEDLAEQYGITPGKAALILKLIQSDPMLSFEKLAGMPMTQLVKYLKAAGIDLRDFARYLGDDLDDDDEFGIDDDDRENISQSKDRSDEKDRGQSSAAQSTSGQGAPGAGASKGAAAGRSDDDDDWDDWDDDQDTGHSPLESAY